VFGRRSAPHNHILVLVNQIHLLLEITLHKKPPTGGFLFLLLM
jgi:hypothetical protein